MEWDEILHGMAGWGALRMDLTLDDFDEKHRGAAPHEGSSPALCHDIEE